MGEANPSDPSTWSWWTFLNPNQAWFNYYWTGNFDAGLDTSGQAWTSAAASGIRNVGGAAVRNSGLTLLLVAAGVGLVVVLASNSSFGGRRR